MTEEKKVSIEEAINSGNLKLAEELLEQYKQSFGKTPQYIYFLAKLKIAQNELKAANENLKILYYYFPVFMAEKNDYKEFLHKYITNPLNNLKHEMNTLLAKLALRSPTSEINIHNKPDTFDMKDNKEITNELEIEVSISEREKLRKRIMDIIDEFKKILEIEPRQLDVISCLVQCYSELGFAEEVLRLKNKLDNLPSYWENLRKKRVESTLQEAKKAYKEGNYDLTNKIISLGLAESVDDPNLLILKAEVLFKQNNFIDSLKILESVIKKYPNNNEALRVKGKVCAAKFEHDYNKAHELLLHAEELPLSSTSQINKAHEALEYFLSALEYDENNVMVLYGVYRCHVLLNNPLKAHTTLMKIYELDPQFKIPKILNIYNKKKNPNEIDDYIPDPCFISSRIYGYNSIQTYILKEFRNRFMLSYKVGHIFCALYKRVGLPISKLPKKSLTIILLKYFIDIIIFPIIKVLIKHGK